MLVDEKAGTLAAISVVAKVAMSVVAKVAMRAAQQAASWAETMAYERERQRVEMKDSAWVDSSAETKADARVSRWAELSALMLVERWAILKDNWRAVSLAGLMDTRSVDLTAHSKEPLTDTPRGSMRASSTVVTSAVLWAASWVGQMAPWRGFPMVDQWEL